MISVHCTYTAFLSEVSGKTENVSAPFRYPVRPEREFEHDGEGLRALSRQKILCHLGETEPHHRYRYRVLPSVPLARNQPLADKVGRSNGTRARRRNVHIRNRELHHSVNSCFLAKRELQMLVIFSMQLPETEEEGFSLDRGERMDRFNNLTIALNRVTITSIYLQRVFVDFTKYNKN